MPHLPHDPDEGFQLNFQQDHIDTSYGVFGHRTPTGKKWFLEVKGRLVSIDVEDNSPVETINIEIPDYTFKEITRAFSNLGRRAWEHKVRELTETSEIQKITIEKYRKDVENHRGMAYSSQEQAARWKEKYLALRDKVRLLED